MLSPAAKIAHTKGIGCMAVLGRLGFVNESAWLDASARISIQRSQLALVLRLAFRFPDHIDQT
jgi:hypothetical protein